MITEADLDQNLTTKLNRLANDDADLYKLITKFETETQKRLGVIDKRLDTIEATLAEILRRLPSPG